MARAPGSHLPRHQVNSLLSSLVMVMEGSAYFNQTQYCMYIRAAIEGLARAGHTSSEILIAGGATRRWSPEVIR